MKYYLVDTENVAHYWGQYAEKADAGDLFLLFYSKNVSTVNMSLFGPPCLRGVQFSFIECYVGTNAMDFQIVTELGRLVTLHPEDEFVIISKDTGFDSVVKYWRNRRIKISRAAPVVDSLSNLELAVVREYRAKLEPLEIDESDLHIAVEILMAAMRLPEKKRRLDTYRRFLKRYGRVDGLTRYRMIGQAVADIAANGPFPPAVPTPVKAKKSKPAKKKKTPSQANLLNQAVSTLEISLSDKQHKKLSNIFRHARTAKNSRDVYQKQLSDSFGSSDGTVIFQATEFLL